MPLDSNIEPIWQVMADKSHLPCCGLNGCIYNAHVLIADMKESFTV